MNEEYEKVSSDDGKDNLPSTRFFVYLNFYYQVTSTEVNALIGRMTGTWI